MVLPLALAVLVCRSLPVIIPSFQRTKSIGLTITSANEAFCILDQLRLLGDPLEAAGSGTG